LSPLTRKTMNFSIIFVTHGSHALPATHPSLSFPCPPVPRFTPPRRCWDPCAAAREQSTARRAQWRAA
jgi:hypothetical protein